MRQLTAAERAKEIKIWSEYLRIAELDIKQNCATKDTIIGRALIGIKDRFWHKLEAVKEGFDLSEDEINEIFNDKE